MSEYRYARLSLRYVTKMRAGLKGINPHRNRSSEVQIVEWYFLDIFYYSLDLGVPMRQSCWGTNCQSHTWVTRYLTYGTCRNMDASPIRKVSRWHPNLVQMKQISWLFLNFLPWCYVGIPYFQMLFKCSQNIQLNHRKYGDSGRIACHMPSGSRRADTRFVTLRWL